jgi:hypothetical protein
MRKWVIGLLGGLSAVVAMLVRGIFARRTEERLTKERDKALVDAEEAKILAEGKANEADVLRDLRTKTAALDALDGDDLVGGLNARNK